MKLLILNASVCDTQSSFNGRKCDILINNGIIEHIKPASKKSVGPAGTKALDIKGAQLSPGWFDMRVALREPGFEYKEDLVSMGNAAAAGGFTSIACLPSATPTIQTKADIEFIYTRSEKLPVHVFPYGAITHNREGVEMNELYDMHKAGAIAYTDGNKTLMHAGLMMRAMMYAKVFNGLVISHAEDENLAAGGRMHEGIMSLSLGMKGIPNMAEELIVTRDIELARYASSRIHFSHLSSKGSVDIIRKAKKQGMPVTCDVAVASLVFTDDALSGFDSVFKLTPPLRSKTDRKALWDGVNDGTIDCIVSDHHPEDMERKDVEFEYAAQGMTQLQTAWSLLNTHAPDGFDKSVIIRALTANPRQVLNRKRIAIEVGSQAEITIFDSTQKWMFTEKNNLSRSRNSPVLNTSLTGKVIATINKGQLFKNI